MSASIRTRLRDALAVADQQIAELSAYLDRLTAQHLERTERVAAHQATDLYTLYDMRSRFKALYAGYADCLERLARRVARDRAFCERSTAGLNALDTVLRHDAYVDRIAFWTDAVSRLQAFDLCGTDVRREYRLVGDRAKRMMPVRGPVTVAAYVRPDLRYNGERVENIVEHAVRRAVLANRSIYAAINAGLATLLQRQALSRPRTLAEVEALAGHVAARLDESRAHLEAATRNLSAPSTTTPSTTTTTDSTPSAEKDCLAEIWAAVQDNTRLESLFERFNRVLREELATAKVAPVQAALARFRADTADSLDAINANLNRLADSWRETRTRQGVDRESVRELVENYAQQLSRTVATSEDLAATVLDQLAARLNAIAADLVRDVRGDLQAHTDQVAARLLEYATAREADVKAAVTGFLQSVRDVGAEQRERVDALAVEVAAVNERLTKQEAGVETIVKMLKELGSGGRGVGRKRAHAAAATPAATTSTTALRENVDVTRKRRRLE